MRPLVLLPDALLLVGALACLAAGPDGPWRIRPRRRRWFPLGVTVLLAVAFLAELMAGASAGALFTGFQQDRLSLFLKAAVLLALLVGFAATDWDLEPVAGAGWRPAGWTLLGGFGVLVAASAAHVASLWAGLLVAFAGAALAVATRPVAVAPRGRRGVAAAERGFAFAVPLVLALGLILAGVALAGAWSVSGQGSLSGLAASRALTSPNAAVAILVLVGVAGLGGTVVAAAAGFGRGRRGAGSPYAGGAAAAVVVLAAGAVLLRLEGVAEASFRGWAFALGLGGAAALVAGGFGALAARRLPELVSRLTLYQAGWVLAGFSTHDRTGLAAAAFALAALAVAAAAAKPLAAAAEDAGPAELNARRPERAAALAAVLLSLAGIPPLAGFFGDFGVAAQLSVESGFWVLAVALLSAVVAAAALMRGLRRLYLDPVLEAGRRPVADVMLPGLAVGGSLLAGAVLAIWGLFAYPILDLALQGASAAGLR